MFDRLAEIAAEYLRKGSQVYIEGKIRTRKWQDKEGNDRYTTEIIANEMSMLGGRGGDRGRPRRPTGRAIAARSPPPVPNRPGSPNPSTTTYPSRRPSGDFAEFPPLRRL